MEHDGTHDSELFLDRLVQVYNNSGHTHASLAEEAGVSRNTVQRLLSNGNNLHVIKTLMDISRALGVSMKTLLDFGEMLPSSSSVGIKSIDAMVTQCYNEESATGVEGFAAYAHDDYRVYNDSFARRVSERYAEARSNGGGLSIETERTINAQNSAVNGNLFKRHLHKHYFFEGLLIVVYMQVNYVKSSPNVATERKIIDHIVLEHDKEAYEQDGNLRPKIMKRHWAHLLFAPNSTSSQ